MRRRNASSVNHLALYAPQALEQLVFGALYPRMGVVRVVSAAAIAAVSWVVEMDFVYPRGVLWYGMWIPPSRIQGNST